MVREEKRPGGGPGRGARPHYQGSCAGFKPRDYLNWPLGKAAGDPCPHPLSSPERIRAPPTGEFQIAGGRKWAGPRCGRKQGPVVFSRTISQLQSLRYELQNYESVDSRKSREGIENELLGCVDLGDLSTKEVSPQTSPMRHVALRREARWPWTSYLVFLSLSFPHPLKGE